MLRRLLMVALFLAVWFAGDRALAYLAGAFLDRSHEPIAELYGDRGVAGVVLLGNSRAYRSFDLGLVSREFGGKVLNLALPGSSMELSEALLEDYIDRYGAPHVLVVELSELMGDPDPLKNMRPFLSRSQRLSLLVKEHFPKLYYAGLVSHLFNYNSDFALNAAHKVLYPMPDLALEGSLSESEIAAITPGSYFVPHAREIGAAQRLIETVRRNNIDTRFVLAPVVREYAEANDIAALRRAVGDLTAGFQVWDLAENPPMEPRYFVDQNHLNREGVGIFMQALRERGFFASPARLGRVPDEDHLN